jgi:hypothetical protein
LETQLKIADLMNLLTGSMNLTKFGHTPNMGAQTGRWRLSRITAAFKNSKVEIDVDDFTLSSISF